MRIYIGHSTGFDFKEELYEPIKSSAMFSEHEFVFPHEVSLDVQNKKVFYQTIDLFVAEVSYPSTGLGIELGWAEELGKRIVCIHTSNSKPSSALVSVCDEFLSYSDEEGLQELLKRIVA